MQLRLAEKESTQFMERETAKKEKKIAEDILGKISISPIKDAIDFKVWAETVQNIKDQTVKLEPSKRKVRLKHLLLQSIEDKDLKEKLSIIDCPFTMMKQITEKYGNVTALQTAAKLRIVSLSSPGS